MNKRRFPPDDPVLKVAIDATNKVHELHMDTHYLTCRESNGWWGESRRVISALIVCDITFRDHEYPQLASPQ
jgi:hypothetical protein